VPLPKDRRIVVAVVLAALLVVLLVVVAIAQGIGDPSVPSGDVAVVEDAPDSHISQEEFDSSLKQTAALQGVQKVPEPSDAQYATLRDAAVDDLLLGRWIRGEAAERGITLSESEISNGLDEVVKRDFGGNKKQFQKYLKQSHITPPQARAKVEIQLLADQLQREILGQEPGVSETEIEDFYQANLAQFEQPETRDVRRILNKDQAKVERAKALLEQDDSPASWKKVAARFSTEEATKDSGGLVEGVTVGQSEPGLEEQIFSAPEGQLVGPFESQSGYYLIQVEKITLAETTPIAEVTEQIQQQLTQGKQQQIAQDFQQDFVEKWGSRTFCADDYVIPSCENYSAPLQTTPGAAPVISRPAAQPGQAAVFPGQPIPALPQGPIQPVSQQPGIIGPPGGELPPGTVPQGGAPTAP
jgi:foldase protein PrsA